MLGDCSPIGCLQAHVARFQLAIGPFVVAKQSTSGVPAAGGAHLHILVRQLELNLRPREAYDEFRVILSTAPRSPAGFDRYEPLSKQAPMR